MSAFSKEQSLQSSGALGNFHGYVELSIIFSQVFEVSLNAMIKLLDLQLIWFPFLSVLHQANIQPLEDCAVSSRKWRQWYIASRDYWEDSMSNTVIINGHNFATRIHVTVSGSIPGLWQGATFRKWKLCLSKTWHTLQKSPHSNRKPPV